MDTSKSTDPYFSDYINTTIVFGGIDQRIFSKDFKGGHIRTLFGETAIDFSKADIKGVAILDISMAFGETKITVPAGWQVEDDLSKILAEVHNEQLNDGLNTHKKLILRGTSICAKVKIKTAFVDAGKR